VKTINTDPYQQSCNDYSFEKMADSMMATCRIKAGYLVDKSMHVAWQIWVGMSVATAVLVALHMLWYIGMYIQHAKRANSRSWSAVGLSIAGHGLVTAANVVCLLTYIYAVEHEFYCQSNPQWQNWGGEWVVAGIGPGWTVAVEVANWLWLVVQQMKSKGVGWTGTEEEGDFNSMPWGLWVLLAPPAIAILAVYLALGLVYSLLQAMCSCSLAPFAILLCIGEARDEHNRRTGPGIATGADGTGA
jgi:hypothetical protein